MGVRKPVLSAGLAVLTATATVLLTPTAGNAAAAEPFTLHPGQQACVTATADHYPDDGVQENVRTHGVASVPVRYVTYVDVIDGTDGFEHARLFSQTAQDIPEFTAEHIRDPGDIQSFSEQFWFCAENRSGSVAEGTLEISVISAQAQGYVVESTATPGWHVYGKLRPGQEVCVGGGGRSANMETIVGQRRAEVTMRNSRTTKKWITYDVLYTSIDSAFPQYPDGLIGCVKNADSATMNFEFTFHYYH
jgi:hypothetical protein